MSNALTELLSDADELRRLAVLAVNAAKSPTAKEKLAELLARHVPSSDPAPTPSRPVGDRTADERQRRFRERQARSEICTTVVVNANTLATLGLDAGQPDRSAIARAIEARLRNG